MSRVFRTYTSAACLLLCWSFVQSFNRGGDAAHADDADSAGNASKQAVLTGQAAFTDAAHESPGTRRHLTVADLPAPAPDQSVDNGPSVVNRPANAWPQAPAGFKVELYANGLENPRLLRTAPNGDIFLAESTAGSIKVFRGIGADGKAKQVSVFATSLHQPSELRSIRPVRIRSGFILAILTPLCAFLIATET